MARPGKPGRVGIGIEGSAGRLGNVRLRTGSLGIGIGGNAHRVIGHGQQKLCVCRNYDRVCTKEGV